MNQTLDNIVSLAKQCQCGHHHYDISIEQIVVSHEAFNQLAAYLRYKQYKKVVVVADNRTFTAAGRSLCDKLKKRIGSLYSVPYSVR